ncbi:sugar phosphate isomerase/epimerase [Microbacterium sp.]|uniref:sugar phosphate isomerase/epimerase family protein n=1 Tax=Microbacterium sp. TaxID=51671 RepID=UPI002E308EA5|nr:sugar phosphate isomerase/epimerase [Microbacterium sp.]HEX5727867.1 sugar phosphate isomerase/epimerase [Microbacterium sp.]
MAQWSKVAVNPLPWVMDSGAFILNEETLGQAMKELSDAGFNALHSDPPQGMSPEAYRAFLAQFGFRPAPGYFSAELHSLETRPEVIDAARAHARMIAELGLTETFVAADIDFPRLIRPAIGRGGSPERTKVIAETLALAADAAAAEGVRFALHPHIATPIETEEETRQVLDETAGSALGFGPDTGHLEWAGMVSEQIIGDYSDRVIAVHLKDVDGAAKEIATRYTDDFMSATAVRHIWTEPGRGKINFNAVFDALPASFNGWFVVEVDVPNLDTAFASSKESHDYLARHPRFEVAA